MCVRLWMFLRIKKNFCVCSCKSLCYDSFSIEQLSVTRKIITDLVKQNVKVEDIYTIVLDEIRKDIELDLLDERSITEQINYTVRTYPKLIRAVKYDYERFLQYNKEFTSHHLYLPFIIPPQAESSNDNLPDATDSSNSQLSRRHTRSSDQHVAQHTSANSENINDERSVVSDVDDNETYEGGDRSSNEPEQLLETETHTQHRAGAQTQMGNVHEQGHTKRRGRPPKSISALQAPGKRLRARRLFLACNQNTKFLLDMTVLALARKNKVLAVVLKKIRHKSRAQLLKLIKLMETAADKDKLEKPFTPDDAIDVGIKCSLSSNQYRLLGKVTRSRNFKLFPSVKEYNIARRRCWPEGIISSANCVQVSVKNLMTHTLTRLFESRKEVLDCLFDRYQTGLLETEFHVTYGSDGSTGHAQYALKGGVQDDSMIATTCNYLLLQTCEKKEIVFVNRAPSSIRRNRLIRLEFAKETVDKSRALHHEIETQFNDLVNNPMILPYKDKQVSLNSLVAINDISFSRFLIKSYIFFYFFFF